MGQLDTQNCFTYAYSAGTFTDFVQAITADAASTNYIDLRVAGIRISGGSKPPYLIVKVITAFVTTVSINFRLQTGSTTGFATTLRDVFQARFALAALTAGALIINQALPNLDFQRYLRMYFDVFTSASAGTVIAYLSDGPEPGVADVDQTEAAS